MVLVSRIDGPTEANIISMIDSALAGEALQRAGTPMPGRYYVDRQIGGWPNYPEKTAYDNAFGVMASMAPQERVEINTDASHFTSMQPGPASLYAGWYNPLINTNLSSWTPGAIAFEVNSWSGLSLKTYEQTAAKPDYRSCIAWFVSQGVAGTFGPFYEPLLSAFPRPNKVLEALFAGLTWAEVFWSCVPHRRWMMILVGDPLYRPFPRTMNQTQS